jgi:hypothetical protein
VSALGAVGLTANVARTHIGQTFSGLQVFSSGLSANGLTGTVLTPTQTNITSLGTLTTLSSAGLTSSQTINVSSGGLIVQAGGASITGGATVTGGARFFGGVGIAGGMSVTGSIDATGSINANLGYTVGPSSINPQTVGYTLVAGDNGKIITINSASAVTLTAGTAVGTTGFSCVIMQLGAGQVSIAGASTTINSFAGTKISGQYAAATLFCYATNTFAVVGNLTT